MFDSWARILKRVDNSVLWLMAEGDDVRRNLRGEIAKRGIASDRLIFAERIPSAEHLARMRLADLFLDSLPYNSHTTASDALWVGLPILTLQGQSFAARVASSLLTAIGLPQLITHSLEQYENLAVELASNSPMLHEIKNTINANKQETPLFNSALTTRQIESAYEKMVERTAAKQPPCDMHL
jgi:predicted O-linked N-acetylglucosamine transferase (SPINDLY family)